VKIENFDLFFVSCPKMFKTYQSEPDWKMFVYCWFR